MRFEKLGPFVHRDNRPRSSTFDTICTRCFRTAGTRGQEAELAQDEQNHVCRARDLSRFTVKNERPDGQPKHKGRLRVLSGLGAATRFRPAVAMRESELRLVETRG